MLLLGSIITGYDKKSSVPKKLKKRRKIMRKSIMIAVLFGMVFFSTKVWSGSHDVFVFSDKNKTTVQAESWSNMAGPLELGGYFKVNMPKKESLDDYFSEAYIDYLPIKLGPAEIGVGGNAEIKTGSKILYRANLSAKFGPFFLRYAPMQSDQNHKLSLCWFWEKNNFQLFGYINHNLMKNQKALNVSECYIGYRVIKHTVLFVGAKPIWSQGQAIKIEPGIGIKFDF